MKEDAEVKVQLHSFLTCALDGGEWLTLRLVCFAPGERTWHPFSRRLVGPWRWFWGIGELKNLMPLPETESRLVKPTAQSQYVLCYSGSLVTILIAKSSRCTVPKW